MKRIIIAIVLGIVLPVLWLFLVGAISSLLFVPGLIDIRINGEIAPGLLFAPVMMPAYLDILMRQYGILPPMLNSFEFRVFSLIAFNWVFYGIVFYLLLGKLKRFKKQIVTGEPPPPPVFGS